MDHQHKEFKGGHMLLVHAWTFLQESQPSQPDPSDECACYCYDFDVRDWATFLDLAVIVYSRLLQWSFLSPYDMMAAAEIPFDSRVATSQACHD